MAPVLAIHAYSAVYAARARSCKFQTNCKGCDACNSQAAMQACMPQHACCIPGQLCSYGRTRTKIGSVLHQKQVELIAQLVVMTKFEHKCNGPTVMC